MSLGSGNLTVYDPQAFANVNTVAGSGLAGGGTQSADHRFDIGVTSGLTANADDISIKWNRPAGSGQIVRWDGTGFVTNAT
jgi:hypothetical protein